MNTPLQHPLNKGGGNRRKVIAVTFVVDTIYSLYLEQSETIARPKDKHQVLSAFIQ